MKVSELKQEIVDLKQKLEVLSSKNRILNELATFYADPMTKWDKGAKAKKAIKQLAKGYKPVDSNLAIMFREKEIYPFIEFGNYIDTSEDDDE